MIHNYVCEMELRLELDAVDTSCEFGTDDPNSDTSLSEPLIADNAGEEIAREPIMRGPLLPPESIIHAPGNTFAKGTVGIPSIRCGVQSVLGHS
jgi:hypothetical protein